MPQEAVRPYLMDLGSTNGTFINNERLDAQRFYEVLEKVRSCLPRKKGTPYSDVAAPSHAIAELQLSVCFEPC